MNINAHVPHLIATSYQNKCCHVLFDTVRVVSTVSRREKKDFFQVRVVVLPKTSENSCLFFYREEKEVVVFSVVWTAGTGGTAGTMLFGLFVLFTKKKKLSINY